jgi:hypothetical protein
VESDVESEGLRCLTKIRNGRRNGNKSIVPRDSRRRRELRQFEAARIAAQPGALTGQDGSFRILFPLVAGGPLAAYNPKLAVAAGTVTLLVAALYKKDWLWWIVGILILAFGPRY